MIEQSLIRLSVSESAKLFGLSAKTIRGAIRNNEIKYVVVRGRYKITFQSLLAWSQASTRRNNQLTNKGLGQFVDQWKIKNKKFSPNEKLIK